MKVATTHGLLATLREAGFTLDFDDYDDRLVIRWARAGGERGLYSHDEALAHGVPAWTAAWRRRAVAVRELVHRLIDDGHVRSSDLDGCECREVRISTHESLRPVNAYVRGVRRYRDGEPLEACQGPVERLGWMDAHDEHAADAAEEDPDDD